MRRRTFDWLMSTAGVVVTIVLIAAGALLWWGASFAHDNVHNQLVQQQIYFPAKGSAALAPPQIGSYLDKYAGQQLTTGAQAEAYADHFIAVHLSEVANGKTYAQVSSEVQQLKASNPDAPQLAKLQSQQATLFKGETLRGLLLNAYAFGTMGDIAWIAALVSFSVAGVMALLSGLGMWHLRHTDPAIEVVGSGDLIRARTHRVPVPVSPPATAAGRGTDAL